MGGTGDLAVEKLIPALHTLRTEGHEIEVIGTSRHAYGLDGYLDLLDDKIEGDWSALRDHIGFCQLDFYDDAGYRRLDEQLGDTENVIFYLATLPTHYDTVTEGLVEHDLLGNRIIAYEKPFGDDLEHAQRLNSLLQDLVPEEQVFRVDHYLSKDLVENMSVFRFANVFLEPIWNSLYIDHVQIVASEDFGVDDRVEYYDKYGAIRDVVQSHLIQLLALTAMEEPDSLSADDIRDEKHAVLANAEIADGVLGQYEGYPEDSDTETFAALEVDVDNERWQDVPIYLLAGKELEKKQTHIYVEFKNLPCKLFEGVCPLYPNGLVVDIQPGNAITLRMNTKSDDGRVETSALEYKEEERTDAYENVFRELLRGDQRSFVRYDEIEEAWRIVDEYDRPEPFTYERGAVPEDARAFLPDGHSWHDI